MHAASSSTGTRGTPSRRGKSPRFWSDGQSLAGSLQGNHLDRPVISCLDIPVQGASPINKASSRNSSSTNHVQVTQPESIRAPRKSKTDALAALNNQARSSSPSLDDMDVAEDLTARYRNAPPIAVTRRLDMSTVKTSTPRVPPDQHRQPRPFGLTNCPVFFPTVEEFKEPMAYIRSISPQASNFGICKIVPPEDWKMPFVTDTEVRPDIYIFNYKPRYFASQHFRFKTRLQRLNNIEASSRAKLNFLEQLYQFHKQQGNSRVVVPTINHKPLDLWLLRKEVRKLGGYDAVSVTTSYLLMAADGW